MKRVEGREARHVSEYFILPAMGNWFVLKRVFVAAVGSQKVSTRPSWSGYIRWSLILEMFVRKHCMYACRLTRGVASAGNITSRSVLLPGARKRGRRQEL